MLSVAVLLRALLGDDPLPAGPRVPQAPREGRRRPPARRTFPLVLRLHRQGAVLRFLGCSSLLRLFCTGNVAHRKLNYYHKFKSYRKYPFKNDQFVFVSTERVAIGTSSSINFGCYLLVDLVPNCNLKSLFLGGYLVLLVVIMLNVQRFPRVYW